MNQNTKPKKLGQFWMDFLKEEFSKETDRAAAVLTASLLENALTDMLKVYLAPSAGSQDDLFDGPMAPLHSFSSKIQISQRLGLISLKLSNDINLIKKIRNEFAHNVHGSNLESGKIREFLTHLVKSSKIIEGHNEIRNLYPEGPRGDFFIIANIILFHLQSKIDGKVMMNPIKVLEEEWIYGYVYEKPKPEPSTLLENKN
jgi:hypothetical protein